jgi:hypothetical protein
MHKTGKTIYLWYGWLWLHLYLPEAICQAQEQPTDIRDIKPPLAYPWNFWYLVIAVAVIGLALLAWLLTKRLSGHIKIEKRQPVVPPRPAWEIALEQLAALLARNLPASGQIKEYFSGLSDIVRHYIERRFDLRAPEMTTPEFLEAMNKAQALRHEHKQILREFLACCDMVKFAKYGPSEQEIEAAADMTKRFIYETQPATVLPEKAQRSVPA